VTAHELPPSVQAHVTSLASEALGRMPSAQVPAALRKSASFAPARRVKLVGRQIAEAVADDDAFRERLATQVKVLVPRVVEALESDRDIAAADLAQAAAVAYLVRGPGWRDLVESVGEAERRQRDAPIDHALAAVERITAQLSLARGEAKQQRDKLRAQIDSLKADNAALRRTLGQTRTDLKDARAEAERASDDLDEVRREAEVASRATSAEVRRLRAKVGDLEAETSASRRAARDDRDAEGVRLRLLLDTMVEAANGLRRELALPPSTGLPADVVAAVEPDAPSAASQIGRALLSDDPILLRRLLELPRLHLIVDGYNVSKEAFPQASLEQQRTRLAAGLAGLVSGKGIETTLVFDGADLLHTPVFASPRGVRVRFSPPGVIADDVVRQLVAAEPTGRPVVVVSTDREVAESVTKMGARSVASSALVAIIGH
jgi:predicted RNA-binding protein with PIN domain/outer membrane murein-binding lipoprotein Lpp